MTTDSPLCLGFASIILVAQFTFGMWSYEGRIVWQVLFKEPFIWAFLLALAFMFFRVHLPSFVDKTLEQLGHLTIPLLLLALGFALAEIKITGFARAMIFSGVRLGIFFGVSWLVVLILGFEGETRAIVLLMSVLPASTINILMANQTGKIDMPPLTVTTPCAPTSGWPLRCRWP